MEPNPSSAATATRGSTWLRLRSWCCRAGLIAATLLGAGILAAACGGGPSSPGVTSGGQATITTTGSSTAPGGSSASLENSALAYVACMRTHGEPNMPNLTIDGPGHISVAVGSGFDPNTPQYTAANKACEHLLSKKGGSSAANTITPADQADYLKAAACMRSHGVPNFPDPTFQNNSVEFNNSTPIDTNSPQYTNALATCEKLIPAGLPYSSTNGS